MEHLTFLHSCFHGAELSYPSRNILRLFAAISGEHMQLRRSDFLRIRPLLQHCAGISAGRCRHFVDALCQGFIRDGVGEALTEKAVLIDPCDCGGYNLRDSALCGANRNVIC